MAKTFKCPITGKILEIEELRGPLFQVVCPDNWRSRLFKSFSEAEDWCKYIPVSGLSVNLIKGVLDIKYYVSGNGWRSKLFNSEPEALFWSQHRKGVPLKSAQKPATFQVTEREALSEDVDLDSPENVARDLHTELSNA